MVRGVFPNRSIQENGNFATPCSRISDAYKPAVKYEEHGRGNVKEGNERVWRMGNLQHRVPGPRTLTSLLRKMKNTGEAVFIKAVSELQEPRIGFTRVLDD